MQRYSKIIHKQKREIVLLRGSGCIYKKCTFCDYYHDKNSNEKQNFELNQSILNQITGEFHELEVINSGSVFELDEQTLSLIKKICLEKQIRTLHFESHYLYHNKINQLRQDFYPIQIKMKLGLETFDEILRENLLNKGIKEKDPAIISNHFEEANFLFGIKGQTLQSMENDIQLGLQYFERICINIMCKNTTAIQPDKQVIDTFMHHLYLKYKDHERIDILIDKTDFGVGD